MAPSRELERLNRLCIRARNLVAQLFVDNVVSPPDTRQSAAWGQYLDLRQRGLSQQYGVYGTTAGIQVLAMHDARVHAEILETASDILPLGDDDAAPEIERIRSYFTGKDLHVTFKVTALVDAVRPDLDSVPGTYPIVDKLLAMRIPGGGWPDFRSQSLDEFHGPKVHATAVALLSLSRFPDVRASDDCREAMEWLARHIDPDLLSIATLAICCLALAQCRGHGDTSRRVDQALENCRKAVLRWAIRSTPGDVRRALEATEYLLPKRRYGPTELPLRNEDQDFRFLLYSPHCLAALALMRCRPSLAASRVRRYVIDVVHEVAKRTCDTGSFVAAGRSAISSVEHLWIYRLLSEFHSWHLHIGRMHVLRDWLWRLVAPRRWVTVSAFVVTAWVLLSQSASVLSGILLTVVTTVSLTVVSTLIYDEVFGR